MANPNPSPATRFLPGQSGNPAGGPKRKLERVQDVLAEAGKHPVRELLALMPELRPREQAEIWVQLLSYIEAKPKEAPREADGLLGEMLKRLDGYSDQDLIKKAEEAISQLKAA